MDSDRPILVCFAVKEEANVFEKRSASIPGIHVLKTGMGPRNAERSSRKVLSELTPRLVITSGFAGGLNPDLSVGTVVFDCPPNMELFERLISSGARLATFISLDHVITTAEDKRMCQRRSHADAVDMESETIRRVCSKASVPSATVRVISDAADEDLPLDFNLVMNEQSQMDYSKLALRMIRSPAVIIKLIQFGLRTGKAARVLAATLDQVIRKA